MRSRNIPILFYVNRAEKDRLDSIVATSGKSQSDFLRSLTMGFSFKQKPPVEYAELLRQISGMANNLNQIARHVNAQHEADSNDVKRAYELASECNNILRGAFL